MSAISSRVIEVWRSSLTDDLAPIHGAFVIPVVPAPMISQSIEFLRENQHTLGNAGPIVSGFLRGAGYISEEHQLCYWKSFADAQALFEFSFAELASAVRELEIHLDINFTFSKAEYRAFKGAGLEQALLVFERQRFGLGVGFELEARGAVSNSIQGGDITLSSKLFAAQQYYSTGRVMLGVVDQLPGLIESAFFQFYLALETLLDEHRKDKALANGRKLYPAKFSGDFEAVVDHVFRARHRFFGHANADIQAHSDPERSYAIALQTLVVHCEVRKVFPEMCNRLSPILRSNTGAA